MTSPSLWPLVTAHLERWRGDEPLALGAGLRLLDRALAEAPPPRELDGALWSRTVVAASTALARLIDLGGGDSDVADRARAQAARLAPLVATMTGDYTSRLAKAWRAA